jgi:hypothetical protein
LRAAQLNLPRRRINRLDHGPYLVFVRNGHGFRG